MQLLLHRHVYKFKVNMFTNRVGHTMTCIDHQKFVGWVFLMIIGSAITKTAINIFIAA